MSSKIKPFGVTHSLYCPINPNFKASSAGFTVTMKQGSEVKDENSLMRCYESKRTFETNNYNYYVAK